MINEELLKLLSQIQGSIQNGDIKGYKDLLYLINQNNHMDNHEEVSMILNDFIELLFRDNIIMENCESCGPNAMSQNMDKGLTYGKEKPTPREPLDIQVMGAFHGILPLAILPSVEQNIRQRFNRR